jgi:hypothetical protein
MILLPRATDMRSDTEIRARLEHERQIHIPLLAGTRREYQRGVCDALICLQGMSRLEVMSRRRRGLCSAYDQGIQDTMGWVLGARVDIWIGPGGRHGDWAERWSRQERAREWISSRQESRA